MQEKAELLLKVIKDQGLPITALAVILGWMYYLDWVDRTIDYEEKQELRVTIRDLSKEVWTLNRSLLECHQDQLQEMKQLIQETKQALEDNKN